MNIFVLHEDPVRAAAFHCDKHVLKMIVETAQILSTAHHVLCPDTTLPGIYKATHRNHPCSVWARLTGANYLWLAELGMALCDEYRHRFNRVHKTSELMSRLSETVPELLKSTYYGPLTMLPVVMPDHCKIVTDGFVQSCPDPVLSYRNLYMTDKRHLAKWTKRPVPDWFV